MYKIDKDDIRIINLLVKDGRMSCAEIARTIGNISERSVRYRIERLKAEGVIEITATVNPKMVGYEITADVWLEVDSDAILSVAQKMTEYECVSYVACAIGETDVSVQVLGHDTAAIYHFVTEVIGKTPGVRKTTTSIVPMVLKDTQSWQVPESSSPAK
jgi:DNA-binding Lrp family transcriptional regulator